MESILIIDDEASILTVLSDALSDKYECHTAPDAESAFAMLDRKEFVAVITDISLPGQSGLEVLGILRQNKPETPVIVISGIHDLAYAQGLIEMGAFGYLPKPLSLTDIDSMLNRAVEARRRGLQDDQQVRAARYELQVEASLSGVLVFEDQAEQGLVMIAGITRDLSQTGAGIIVPVEGVDFNELVGQNFQLVLGMIEGSMALDAQVVRCDPIDAERCVVGAKFVNLSGRDRMQLLLYLQAHRVTGEGEKPVAE
jgi:DNA-binding NarL/FixJ family response regulator